MAGFPGERGSEGDRGVPGPFGMKGLPGEPGGKGTIGNTGPLGDPGNPGSPGHRGVVGLKGRSVLVWLCQDLKTKPRVYG